MESKVANKPLEAAVAVRPSASSILSELFKARLTMLVLITTAVGYFMGARGSVDWLRFAHCLLGTGLVACGASALNQLLERDLDALMKRTRNRPLPAGHLTPNSVLLIGGVACGVGLLELALAVNALTALLGAITLISYVWIYTPLKRVTTLNTIIGAIPGALPPLMGWTASRGVLSPEGWSLFAILFFWQLPHFFAIAWIYRDEYAKAGFAMLPVVDVEGARTGASSVSHSMGLLMVSLSPFVLGMAGRLYLGCAIVLGLAFLICAIRFSKEMTIPRARALFFASIIYLPLSLIALTVDKLK